MPTLSYCLHQAQVCLSMARRTEDPNVKRRYEELAVDFMERVGGRRDAEVEPWRPLANDDKDASPRW